MGDDGGQAISVVEIQWRSGRCRVESGLFFPDDTFIALSPADEGRSYAIADRVGLDVLLAGDEEGWFELEPRSTARRGDFELACGGGSWEGEGYVAVARDSRLLWLLHLHDSEIFEEVEIEGDLIVARSAEYPVTTTWRIPLAEPTRLAMTLTRDV